MLNTSIAKAYRSYLNASAVLQSIITPMLRGDHLPAKHVAAFALEHAHFYQCAYVIRENGSVRFFLADEEQTSENVHHAAQKAWTRGIGKFVAVAHNRGGGRNRKAEGEKLFSRFEKLSAADKRLFRKLLGV